jgi:predicted enzyme related to lactoylglutathione lyase
VRDLDAMIAQLHEAGITVDVHPEAGPNGRFARPHDPEGNPIAVAADGPGRRVGKMT